MVQVGQVTSMSTSAELLDWIDLVILDEMGSLDDIIQDIAGTDHFGSIVPASPRRSPIRDRHKQAKSLLRHASAMMRGWRGRPPWAVLRYMTSSILVRRRDRYSA